MMLEEEEGDAEKGEKERETRRRRENMTPA